MKLGKIAMRNISRNRRRSLLSGSATAIASMSIVLFFALAAGMIGNLEDNISTYVTGHVRVLNREFQENELINPLHLNIPGYEEIAEDLRTYPGVQAVSPRISFPAAIYRPEETYAAEGVGIDFSTESKFLDLKSTIVHGAMPAPGSNEVLIGADLADRIGLSVGDKFTVLTTTRRRSTNAMTFTVAGICRFAVSGFDGTHIFIPLDRVQRLLQMDDSVTEILVRLDSSRQISKLTEEIGSLLSGMGRTDLSAYDWKSSNLLFTFFSMVDIMYAMIGLIFFILASTVLVNTTMMVIYERMREIGTVAALGLKGREIVRLFFYEASIIAIIGSLVGVAAGILITLPLSRTGFDMSSALEGVTLDMSYVIKPRLNWFSTIFVFIYSVIVSSAASFIPSRKAAKIEPVEALRYTG